MGFSIGSDAYIRVFCDVRAGLDDPRHVAYAQAFAFHKLNGLYSLIVGI